MIYLLDFIIWLSDRNAGNIKYCLLGIVIWCAGMAFADSVLWLTNSQLLMVYGFLVGSLGIWAVNRDIK